MALAVLEEVGTGGAASRFRIDTGTNRYFQLKIGRSHRSKNGLDWVDEVYYATPVSMNKAGGSGWNTSTEVHLPIERFEKGNAYVQLFSYKTPQGRSPAFSQNSPNRSSDFSMTGSS